MPQVSACVASRWTSASMVSMRFVPGHRLADRLDHLELPARRVALHQLRAVRPAQLILEGGLDAGLADDVVAQVAIDLELLELLAIDRPGVADDVRQQLARPARRSRRGTGGSARPRPRRPAGLGLLADEEGGLAAHAALDRHEVERRAAERVEPRRRSRAIRAGELGDAREDARCGRASGRSAGRTFTVHEGTLTATGRPARSKIRPRGAGIGTSTVRSAAARPAYTSPLTTWSWKSRPPSAEQEERRGDREGDEPGPRAVKVDAPVVQVGHRVTRPAPPPARSAERAPGPG